MQVFEGIVDEIADKSFWATLYDLTDKTKPIEVAEFPLSKIEEEEKEYIAPGAVFYWEVFENHSKITFKKERWTKEQIERAETEGKHTFERINKIMRAPFTEDQVNSLNAYQKSGAVHPFTCTCGKGELIATKDGWVCPTNCGYKQDWAHDFMGNWDWKKVYISEEMLDRLAEKHKPPKEWYTDDFNPFEQD